MCWEHNWPEKPNYLQVIELRREFGLGFNVWILPVATKERQKYLLKMKKGERTEWSVPMRSHKGDLALFYLKGEKQLRDLFIVKTQSEYQTAGYKRGKDYFATIGKICSLDAPIFLKDLKKHPILQTSGFVRSNFRRRANATEYWPYLFEYIARRNQSAKKELTIYDPERLPAF